MSIQCWDSNSRPSQHEPSPITTRLGLPPNYCYITLFLVGMEALYRPGRPPDLSFRVPVKHKMWSVT